MARASLWAAAIRLMVATLTTIDVPAESAKKHRLMGNESAKPIISRRFISPPRRCGLSPARRRRPYREHDHVAEMEPDQEGLVPSCEEGCYKKPQRPRSPWAKRANPEAGGSALDATAKVLAKSGESMIEAMGAKAYSARRDHRFDDWRAPIQGPLGIAGMDC
ncbi:MAG TPA: hypothetical protein VM165_24315 [Planctomycetaceae bacterium]|nr:hypothetical protein [Planctomycetaceae bacterium]